MRTLVRSVIYGLRDFSNLKCNHNPGPSNDPSGAYPSRTINAPIKKTTQKIKNINHIFTDVSECMDNVGEIFQARELIYGCKPEVSQTLIGITALVSPECKIEIKCIASI